MLRITKKILVMLTDKQKKFIWVLGLMMLLGAIMESLSVSLMLPLITGVTDTENWNESGFAGFACNLLGITDRRSYIQLMIVLLIIVFVVKNIFLFFEYHVQFHFVADGRYNMQSKLMTRYMHKPYTFYLNSSSGEIIRVIKSDTAQAFSMLSYLLTFYTEIIVSMVLAITVLVINPLIAGVTVVVLMLEVLVIAKVVKPRLRVYGDSQREESAAAYKWILQSITGIKSIKVGANEAFFENKYKKHVGKEIDVTCKEQIYGNVPKLITEAFTFVAVLVLMLVMVGNGTDLGSIISQLSAFAIAAMRLIPSANRISVVLNQASFFEGAVDNVLANLKKEGRYMEDTKQEQLALEDKNDKLITCEKIFGLKDVTFAYPGADGPVLSHADMMIEAGQSVGVVGASGAGKTTAIDIMLGLLKPDEGHVLSDDVDIEENMYGWLSHLAYIPQQIFLMDDSIKKNIAFGLHNNEIDDVRVWQVIKEAQLEEFVNSLPEGINTQIGEAGVRLSGGQRQRIGIARALYNDPEILFFDEATSALDNETESAIMEVIDGLKGKRTLIIIAHRLTTIANCDVVYRVENGTIQKERVAN